MAIDASAFVESLFIVLACNESIVVPVSVETFMMLAFGMSVIGSILVIPRIFVRLPEFDESNESPCQHLG